MAVKQDTAKTVVIIDGKQGINELGKLEMEANDLRKTIKGLKKNSDDYVLAQKKLKNVKTDIVAHRKELGLTGMTLRQLGTLQRELRNEIRNTATKGTARYKQLGAQYKKVTREINKQNQSLRGASGIWNGLGKQVKQFGVIAIGYLGATAIFSQLENLISGSARLSDAITNVQKTTNLTDTEVRKLVKSFKAMDTRTPRKELLALATEAGRLGKRGVKDVLGFVNTAVKIKEALGDDLGADVGKNIRILGKLTEQFGIAEKNGVSFERGMDQLGSAINEVAASGTNQAEFLVDYTARLVGISKQSKISAQDQIGYAATFDELGQKVEVSATVMNKLIPQMFRDTSDFAKIAGVEVKDFSELLEKDANAAMILFLKGLNGNNEGLSVMVKKLDELGLDGSRAIGTLSAIAGATDKLKEKQALANKALLEGTSLTEEYDKRNNNLAGSLAKVQKFIASKLISPRLLNWLGGVVGKMAEWTKIPLSETMEEQRIKMNVLATQAFALNEETDDYKTLINQLKKDYPEYLSQLDTDKTTHKELALAIQEANNELINRIAIQKLDEDTIENSTKAAERKVSAEMARVKLMTRVAKKASELGIEEQLLGKTLEEQIKIVDRKNSAYTMSQTGADTYAGALLNVKAKEELAKKAAEDATKAQRILNEVRQAILGDKKNPPPTPASGGEPTEGGSGDPTYVPSPEEIKTALEKSLAALDTAQLELVEKERELFLNREITEQQFQERLKELRLSTLIAKKEAMTLAGEETLAIEKQINDLAFDMEVAQLEKIKTIEQQQTDFIKAQLATRKKDFDDHWADRKKQLHAELIAQRKTDADKKASDQAAALVAQQRAEADVWSAAQSTASAMARAESEREAAISIIASVQDIIRAKMQEAIAGIIAKELATKGLLGLVTAALAVGAATFLFDKFLPPLRKPVKGDGFYHGGDSGNGDAGFADQYGTAAGYVHQNELVIPSYERNDPLVLNAEAALAARNPQFKSSINSSEVPSMGMTPEQGDQLIEGVNALLEAFGKFPTRQKSFVVLSEMEAKARELDNARGLGF
jgi:Phage-related minor tail protein